MTVSSTTTKNTYSASAGQTVFAIAPIDYLDDSVITVKKNGVLLTVGPDYSIDSTNVTLTSGATLADAIVLERVTPKTQTKDFLESDPTPTETFEEGLDRIVRQIQELNSAITALTVSNGLPTPEALKYLRWNAGATALENYDLGADVAALAATVNAFSNSISSLNVRQTASENDIVDIQAKDAAQDVIINNNAASIALLNPLTANHTAQISALQITTADLLQRVQALEAFLGYMGETSLANNFSTVIPDFSFVGTDYSSIHIDYEISRNTDTNYKTSVGKLYLVCRGNGVWTTERGLQVVDADGVTFTIATLPGIMSAVTAMTDDLPGTSYVGKIKYRIVKFEV